MWSKDKDLGLEDKDKDLWSEDKDLGLEDKDKYKNLWTRTWSQRTRTSKLVLKDKDFPRGQQHWVTVKNDLLTDIYQYVISDISKYYHTLHHILIHGGGNRIYGLHVIHR